MTYIMIGISAVSYTHLDVYKRQHHNGAIAGITGTNCVHMAIGEITVFHLNGCSYLFYTE